MCAPKQGPDAKHVVDRALQKLKQAEADLLAAVQLGDHPQNAVLMEVHGFLWEAISRLSEFASENEGRC